MRYYLHESRKAVWSQRIALLFLLLFAITFGLHRIGELPTPVAMKLFGAALIGAVIAVGLGFVALAGIWREGYTGAGKAVAGLAFGAADAGGTVVVAARSPGFAAASRSQPPMSTARRHSRSSPRSARLWAPTPPTSSARKQRCKPRLIRTSSRCL